MDVHFAALLEANTPKANPTVMNGLAVEYMRMAESYIDRVFKSASNSFPEGLVYLGYERCTPHEEYLEITKKENNKRVYDLAKSDIYLVKYKFSFQGEELPPKFVYLPFVGEAGIMHIRGAKFHITPVLSDKVISPGFDTVFVRLLRDKMIFKRCYHSLVVDDVRETVNVPWSNVYRKSKDNTKVPVTTKANTCVVHYLFGKYGFHRTFEKYAGYIPVIGGAEINTTSYPADRYVICQSAGIKPKTYVGEFYDATELRIAIPRERWDRMSKALTVGFFYIVDHFPARFNTAHLATSNIWRILLGHIVFSGVYGENKLYSDIGEHFNSLDHYVDPIVIEKLKEDKYYVSDFYDLLAIIASDFNNLVLDSENVTLSMFGKSLEVLYYVLYDVTSGMFNVNFRLGKLASTKPLTKKDVTETFSRKMRMRAIINLASGKIVAESVSYSGDHKYPKLTSKITEQESLPGGTRGRSKRFVLGQDKHLDISMIEAGSILFLPKANPSPTNKINPFVMLNKATGVIIPNPKFDELRELTYRKLKGITK